MDGIRRALGVKSDADIRAEVAGEPSIRKARTALRRGQKWTGIGDDILGDYQRAEDVRLGTKR